MTDDVRNYREAPQLIEVLAICGSLRAGSLNQLIAQSLQRLAPERMRITIYPGVGELPLYNEDLDHGDPPSTVAQLRAAVQRADALFWAAPEFNHTIASVTKNVIEWISHPLSKAALMGKISAIAVASKGRGGYRGMADLARVLRDLGGHVLAAPEVCIQFAHQCISIGDDGVVRYNDARAETLLTILLRSVGQAVRERSGNQAAAAWRAVFDHAIGQGL